MKMRELSKLQILVLLDHSDFHSKVILMRLLLYGTELLKFFSAKKFTALVLISGLLDASFSNLLIGSHYFMEKVKLVKFSKSLNA